MHTSIAGLVMHEDDGEITYTKAGSKTTFVMNGVGGTGEAWIGEQHYEYEMQDADVVLVDATGKECYRFENSEDGWANFANSVL